VTVRVASTLDLERLVQMGVRFLRDSEYGGLMPQNVSKITRSFADCLEHPERAAIFVSDDEQMVTGFIVMMLSSHYWSDELIASELGWWVEPEHRRSGAGLGLLVAAENWAIEKGARAIHMVAPTPALKRLYTRRGYVEVETVFQRSVAA